MNLKTDIKPVTYLKNKTAEVVGEVSQNRRTMVITQNGEAKIVLMDIDTYSRWRDTMALLKIIATGEAEVEAGSIITQVEVFKKAEELLAKAN